MSDEAPRRYLFTGGGTGGHVAPALAIAEQIRARHPEASFLYVGVPGKAEERMVPRAWASEIEAGKARVRFVRSLPFPGKRPLALLRFTWTMVTGVLRAALLLLSFKPHAVVATGGYVAAPTVFALHLLRRLGLVRGKLYVHEQNAVLGRLNEVAVRVCDGLGLSFPGTKTPGDKGEFVGYPVRGSVTASDLDQRAAVRVAAREALDLPADARVIFAFGGSQGARTINRVLVDALPRLLQSPDVYVIHGTGRPPPGSAYNGARDVERRLEGLTDLPADWAERYRHADFFDDIGTVYAASDLVVSRGGAGALNEICATATASVLVPKANLPGDHQTYNARIHERAGASVVLYERTAVETEEAVESVLAQDLLDVALPVLGDDAERRRMEAAAHELHLVGVSAAIAQCVDALDGSAPSPELPQAVPLPGERVLGLDSHALDVLLRRVDRGELDLTEAERRAALHKIDGYLASGGFTLPARGCRMVGLGGYTQRLDVLLVLAAGRRDDGRYRALPIVRRDAFVGLANLGVLDEDVVEALRRGLDDPYFEARASAGRAVRALCRDEAAAELLRPLMPTLAARTHKREDFDVRRAAIGSLAELARDFDEVAEPLRARRFDPNWKVRWALLKALDVLRQRGVLDDAAAREEGLAVLRTGDGVRTHFPVKEAFGALMDSTHNGATR